jgi:hypothetical protein
MLVREQDSWFRVQSIRLCDLHGEVSRGLFRSRQELWPRPLQNLYEEHVQSQVDQAVWPVRCPMCVADQSRTGGHGGEYGRVPRWKVIKSYC